MSRVDADSRFTRLVPFGFALVLIVVNAALGLAYVHQIHQARIQADRSLHIQTSLSRIEDLAEKAVRAQRNYRLTDDIAQLVLYQTSAEQMPTQLAELRDLIAADQPEQYAELAALVERNMAELATNLSPLEPRSSGELSRALSAGLDQTEAIATATDSMIASEQKLLGRYFAEMETRDTVAVSLGMVVRTTIIVLLVAFVVAIFRRARRNEKLATEHSQALQASEQRFRLIFEESPLGILLADSETHRVVQANSAFRRMLGVANDQVVGRTVAELAHVHDRQLLSDALRGGTDPDVGVEVRYVRRLNGIAWASVRTTQLSASEGHPGLLLTLVHDITREKQVEAELRQAQKMDAIGQLTGGIAHDFNNLLGIIIGNIEFLLDTARDQEQATLAREILNSALSGADLTRRLLAFARRQSLQPRQLDLNAYLPNQVAVLRRLLGEQITVTADLADNLWLVRADPSQIGDALLNLAINARDAMPHGGTLTVATSNVHFAEGELDGAAAPGDYVELSVTDTGIGMPPELLERVLEPFFTTKPPGAGSGLGLSMVFGFAKQSGGHMRLRSEMGHGTTVSLYLLRSSGADRDQGQDGDELPAPRGAESILLVDDNTSMRMVARRHLVSLGYRVSEAGSGPAALEILQAGESYDLLLTDVVMPDGMTGYQLAAAARTLLPDLRILFTTGYVLTKRAEAMPHPGMTLHKPYRRQELAVTVRAALDA